MITMQSLHLMYKTGMFFFSLLSVASLQGVVYGSNTAVSREPLSTYPETDTNNTMLGFGAFENGFILETYKTTCTYDGYFPTNVLANLNGGLLWLNRDFVLEGNVRIPTVGTIATTNRSMKITSTSDLIIPSGASPSEMFTLRLIATQAYADTVRSIDWTFDSRFIAVGAQTGAANEFVVYSFDGTTLTQRAALAFAVNVVTVGCHPSDYYIAIGTDPSGALDEFRIYQFDPITFALTLTASNNYGGMSTVSWHPSGNYIAAVRQSPSPEITVFSFINGTLSQVATADISPNSSLIFDIMDWDPTGNYLGVGTFGTDTIYVYQFDGSSLTQVASQVAGGGGVACLDWSPTDSRYIAIGLATGTQRLRIYAFDAGAGTLTDQPSAYVGEGTAAVQDVAWKPDGSALTMGRIAGTGTDFRLYSFDNNAVTLTLIADVNVPGSVVTTRWSRNGAFVAEGDATANLNVYLGMTTGPNDELIFTNLKTTILSNVILRRPLRFKGNCTINGLGNTLYMDTGSELRVDPGASVLFENLTIDNIQGTNIRCFDSLGTITLSNVQWQQESTFTFTQGRFIFENDVVISGSQIFSYQSAQQSIIDQFCTLLLDTGMTFSYAPSSNARNLLAMVDVTSQLYLRGATLRSTTTGLQLTKGTLIIEDRCEVQSAATVASEGIIFGDGTASNELTIKVLPESGIDVTSGFLVYNNVI
jgi:WD40 repeat protein